MSNPLKDVKFITDNDVITSDEADHLSRRINHANEILNDVENWLEEEIKIAHLGMRSEPLVLAKSLERELATLRQKRNAE